MHIRILKSSATKSDVIASMGVFAGMSAVL